MRLTRPTRCAGVSFHDHHQSANYDDDFGSAALDHSHDRIGLERSSAHHHVDDPADHDDVRHERARELKLISPGRTRGAASGSAESRGSQTNRAVKKLSDEIGMAIVASIFLNHMEVDRLQGDLFLPPLAGVAEVVATRGGRAGATLALPDGEVRLPTGAAEFKKGTLCHCGVIPDPGYGLIPQQYASEPIALRLGHVAHQSMKRKLRSGDWPSLALSVMKPIALDQERGAMKLQPPVEELTLVQRVGGPYARSVAVRFSHWSLSFLR